MKSAIVTILFLCLTAQASPTAVRADGYTCSHQLGPTVYDGDFSVHYAVYVPWLGANYYHPCFHMVGYKIQLMYRDSIFKQGGIQFTGTIDSQSVSPTEPAYGLQPIHVINGITRKDGDGTVTVTTSSKGICGVGYVMGTVGGEPLCLAGGISVRASGTILSKRRLQFVTTQVIMDFIAQPCILRGTCTGFLHDDNLGNVVQPGDSYSINDAPQVTDPNRYPPAYYPLPGGPGWYQIVQQDDGSWQWEQAERFDTASLPAELLDLQEALKVAGPYAYVVADPLQGRYPQQAAIVLDGIVEPLVYKDGLYITKQWILPKDEGQYVRLGDVDCFPVQENMRIQESFCDPNSVDVLDRWLESPSLSDLDGNGRVDWQDWAISVAKQN
jgi:hypothetical protein